MIRIDGKAIAEEVLRSLERKPPIPRFMAAILVGNDRASLHFLKQKERVASRLGIEFRLYRLPITMKTDDLRKEIGQFGRPAPCGGLIVQLPLPEHANKHYVLNAIPKGKDVDLLSEAALGAFYTGRGRIVPPSVGTVEEILRHMGKDLRTLKAVLIGAGFLIGKPVGFWLQNRVSELVVLDREVPNIRTHLGDADVIISGAGTENLFSSEDVKDGAVIIDFGFNQSAKGNVGDFNSEGGENRSFSYTPTPGGTGPVLVAKLFENFYRLQENYIISSG